MIAFTWSYSAVPLRGMHQLLPPALNTFSASSHDIDGIRFLSSFYMYQTVFDVVGSKLLQYAEKEMKAPITHIRHLRLLHAGSVNTLSAVKQ